MPEPVIRDALIVGIQKYDFRSLGEVPEAVENAISIATLLHEQGKFKVTFLPTTPHATQAVSTRQLRNAIVQLFNPPTDRVPNTALFFFLGHGWRDMETGIKPEGYLATSKTDPLIGCYGVSLSWLRDLLQNSPIKEQIVWLDCCYSGELLNDLNDLLPILNDLSTDSSKRRCFITSSRDFEKASAKGLLNQALIEILDCEKNYRPYLTSEQLIEELQRVSDTNGSPQRFQFLPKEKRGEQMVLTIWDHPHDFEETPAKGVFTRTPLKVLDYTRPLLPKEEMGKPIILTDQETSKSQINQYLKDLNRKDEYKEKEFTK